MLKKCEFGTHSINWFGGNKPGCAKWNWKKSGKKRQKEKGKEKEKKKDNRVFGQKTQSRNCNLISYFVSYFPNNENFHQQSYQMHTFTFTFLQGLQTLIVFIFSSLNTDGKTASLMPFEHSLYNLQSSRSFCLQRKTPLAQSAAAFHLQIHKTCPWTP